MNKIAFKSQLNPPLIETKIQDEQYQNNQETIVKANLQYILCSKTFRNTKHNQMGNRKYFYGYIRIHTIIRINLHLIRKQKLLPLKNKKGANFQNHIFFGTKLSQKSQQPIYFASKK